MTKNRFRLAAITTVIVFASGLTPGLAYAGAVDGSALRVQAAPAFQLIKALGNKALGNRSRGTRIKTQLSRGYCTHSGKYCRDDLPHYCAGSNTCYQYFTDAQADCGNSYEICGGPR